QRGRRVMLVDGEEAILFLGRQILGKLGYEVIAHANPALALEDFRARPDHFDAVISDVGAPAMSGIALLGEVRRARPQIATVLTSSRARPEDAAAARAVGLAEPVPKPHTADELAWLLSRKPGP
ncbi:MAG: response regulator, partial [Deltaproteobacteria bacterium]|nr:response regulator [Deltaproteobacteria bacterium]